MSADADVIRVWVTVQRREALDDFLAAYDAAVRLARAEGAWEEAPCTCRAGQSVDEKARCRVERTDAALNAARESVRALTEVKP